MLGGGVCRPAGTFGGQQQVLSTCSDEEQQRALVVEWLQLVPDLDAKFRALDANGDGVVSLLELEQAVAPFEAKWQSLPISLHAMSGATNVDYISLPEFLSLKRLLQQDANLRQKQMGHAAAPLATANALHTPTAREPSAVISEPWLHCNHPDAPRTCSQEPGKWMMFFPMGPTLDAAWRKAKQLYLSGQLVGIEQMKVSTAYPNPRSADPTYGVVIFYCGPASDEASVRRYGERLLSCMQYDGGKTGHMAYKSDAQTMRGTAATGQRTNHMYRIHIRQPSQPKAV